MRMDCDSFILTRKALKRIEERQDAIKELLEEYGEIPTSLSEKIEKEYSMDKLRKWHKISAKIKSIEEFIEKIE